MQKCTRTAAIAARKIATPADGRKRRSHDSRQRIVAAMLALIADGNLSPGAEQVSARAGVGLRSVFRHFKDLESLHQAIAESLTARLEDAARQPFTASDRNGQLFELIERRAATYEAMSPYLRAGQIHRHRSAVLSASHAKFVGLLRSVLMERLPRDAAIGWQGTEAIDVLLSFETWQRLREDQRLSVAKAKDVLKHALKVILGARRSG